jgi:hypothetical protein
MKIHAVLLVPLFLAACDTPRDSERATRVPERPTPSALAGIVRALETVRGVRPDGTVTQVRALECDTRFDPGRGIELERVYLDVTVFAPTNAAAADGFAVLQAALEDEAQSHERVEPASRERVIAALSELDRVPTREDLVSYSDRIRLEVRPGNGATAGLVAAAGADGLAVDTLENYVFERASRPDAVGTVRVRPASARMGGGETGLSLLLRPEFDFQRFDLAQIGAFLASLENDSPAVRLTHLSIERSQHEPDIHRPHGWTFEAELEARGAGSSAAPATASEAPSSSR